MIFGASATHALRALARLAASPPEKAVLGRDLARTVGVPEHYLAKVLATLARAGLLAATRGARGGYRLARPAREVTLLDVVEPFEGARVRAGCLLRPGEPCREDGTCSAHDAWAAMTTSYLGFLETTTLADIRDEAPGDPAPRRRATRASARTTRPTPRRRTTR